MEKGRNIFWGVLFVLGALALLVGKLGYLGGISFWTIFLTIGLLGLLIDGIWHRSFGTILFSLAFLVIVNDEFLGMEAITPWPVLGAALLGTIGLNIIFPKKKWKNTSCYAEDWSKWEGQGASVAGVHQSTSGGETVSEDGEISFYNSFGESVRYLTDDEIGRVNLKNSFGAMMIYFDNAVLKNGVADVYIDNAFGGMELFVPRDWKLVLDVQAFCGAAEEKGRCNPTGANTLLLHGSVRFGAVEIHYI